MFSPQALGTIAALAVFVWALFESMRKVHKLKVTLREQNDHFQLRERAHKATMELLQQNRQRDRRLDEMQERGADRAGDELAALFADPDFQVVRVEDPPKKKAQRRSRRKKVSVWDHIRKPKL